MFILVRTDDSVNPGRHCVFTAGYENGIRVNYPVCGYAGVNPVFIDHRDTQGECCRTRKQRLAGAKYLREFDGWFTVTRRVG